MCCLRRQYYPIESMSCHKSIVRVPCILQAITPRLAAKGSSVLHTGAPSHRSYPIIDPCRAVAQRCPAHASLCGPAPILRSGLARLHTPCVVARPATITSFSSLSVAGDENSPPALRTESPYNAFLPAAGWLRQHEAESLASFGRPYPPEISRSESAHIFIKEHHGWESERTGLVGARIDGLISAQSLDGRGGFRREYLWFTASNGLSTIQSVLSLGLCVRSSACSTHWLQSRYSYAEVPAFCTPYGLDNACCLFCRSYDIVGSSINI